MDVTTAKEYLAKKIIPNSYWAEVELQKLLMVVAQ